MNCSVKRYAVSGRLRKLYGKMTIELLAVGPIVQIEWSGRELIVVGGDLATSRQSLFALGCWDKWMRLIAVITVRVLEGVVKI